MTTPRDALAAAEKYGPKVRWLRQGARLSGRELCRRVGITPSYLSDIEVSRRLPAPDVSDRIADALAIDRDDLWRLALMERLSDRDRAALASQGYAVTRSEALDVATVREALVILPPPANMNAYAEQVTARLNARLAADPEPSE